MRNTYRDYFITKHGAETYNMLIQDTKDKYGYVSTDYAEEEVICDSLVALQKKKGFAEDMAKTLYENGYSKNKIKKFFRTVADFFRKMADMVRSLFDDSTVTQAGVYAERDAAFLDKLSDSFFAGMRKVAEYNFEGVDGETRKMLSETKEIGLTESEINKISVTVDKSIKNKGHIEIAYNQQKIKKVSKQLQEIVLSASNGLINIGEKYVAINASDLYHEYIRHSNSKVESDRG